MAYCLGSSQAWQQERKLRQRRVVFFSWRDERTVKSQCLECSKQNSKVKNAAKGELCRDVQRVTLVSYIEKWIVCACGKTIQIWAGNRSDFTNSGKVHNLEVLRLNIQKRFASLVEKINPRLNTNLVPPDKV